MIQVLHVENICLGDRVLVELPPRHHFNANSIWHVLRHNFEPELKREGAQGVPGPQKSLFLPAFRAF